MKNVIAIATLCAGCLMRGPAFGVETRTNVPPIQSRAQQEGAVSRENLNDDQRAKLRDTNEKFRKEQTAVYEKLRAAQRDLEQTAQADVTSEKAIRAKAAVVGQIEGDLAMLRAKHYKELRAILPQGQAAAQSGLATPTNQYAQRLQNVVRRSADTNTPDTTPPRPPLPK